MKLTYSIYCSHRLPEANQLPTHCNRRPATAVAHWLLLKYYTKMWCIKCSIDKENRKEYWLQYWFWRLVHSRNKTIPQGTADEWATIAYYFISLLFISFKETYQRTHEYIASAYFDEIFSHFLSHFSRFVCCAHTNTHDFQECDQYVKSIKWAMRNTDSRKEFNPVKWPNVNGLQSTEMTKKWRRVDMNAMQSFAQKRFNQKMTTMSQQPGHIPANASHSHTGTYNMKFEFVQSTSKREGKRKKSNRTMLSSL